MTIANVLDDNTCEVCIDVFGNFACFTRPECKIERYSYPCMTPSAARNILNNIYFKPSEFYYEIISIEIMKPIKYLNIKRNEVKDKLKIETKEFYDFSFDATLSEHGDFGRTQRNTYYLKNVYYRIKALLHKRKEFTRDSIKSLQHQFIKRVSGGKCFNQPYLGLRECVCYFSEPNKELNAISINEYIGTMLYDVFNIENNIKLNTSEDKKLNNMSDIVNIHYFEGIIKNGILLIPRWQEVLDAERDL